MRNFYLHFTIILIFALINKSVLSQNNVSISGRFINHKNANVIVRNDVFMNNEIFILSETKTDSSGYFNLNFRILEPQLIRLFDYPFYITPGDSVFAEVKGDIFPLKFTFKGRNSDQYTFAMKYDSLKRSLPFKNLKYNFKNGVPNYYDSLQLNKNVLIKLLNDFSNNHIITPDFKSFISNKIVYDYYDQLIDPVVNNKIGINEMPSKYSQLCDDISFTNDNLVKIREYAFAASHYISYKKAKTNSSDLQIINKYTKGLTKETQLVNYAASIIRNYTSKDSSVTLGLFKQIEPEIQNSEFKIKFSSSKDQLNKYLIPLPKEVRNTIITDSVGIKLTFNDLLKKSSNKIIVLDFWASWCGPCKDGMPKVNLLKKNFNKSEVEFVYLSLDESESNWRKSMEQLKIPGSHYRADENFKSEMAKYFNISLIPRYVIINKSGYLEQLDSQGPNPTKLGLQSQLSKLLMP